MSSPYRSALSIFLACAAAAMAVAGCAPQTQPAARAEFGAGYQADPATVAACQRLNLRQAKIEFSGVPLEQVVQFLRDASKLSIHVRWQALEQAGVSRDTPVNVKLVDVTLAKALQTVLDDVAAATPLGYLIEEGVVVVSTRDDLSRQTFTRVYDVDYLVGGPVWTASQKALVKELLRQALHEPLAKQANVTLAEAYRGQLDKLAEAVEMSARRRRVEELADVIRSTIQPDSWIERSGTTGCVRVFPGQAALVIVQSPMAHQQIVELLGALRGERPAPAATDAVRAGQP